MGFFLFKSNWSVANTTDNALTLVNVTGSPWSLQDRLSFYWQKHARSPVCSFCTWAASELVGTEVRTDPRVLHSAPVQQTVKLSPKIICQCRAQRAKSKPESKLSSPEVLTLPCNITVGLALWLVDLLQVCSDLIERAIFKQWRSSATFFSCWGSQGWQTGGRTRLGNIFVEESTCRFIFLSLSMTFCKCPSSFSSQIV